MVCSYCNQTNITKNHRMNSCPYYLNVEIERTKNDIDKREKQNEEWKAKGVFSKLPIDGMMKYLEKCQVAKHMAQKRGIYIPKPRRINAFQPVPAVV